MCNYGSKAQAGKTVTDVCWKEGCRIPEIMASEVVNLIKKGFMTSNHEDTRNSIFEASVVITQIPKGTGLDEIKKLLVGFSNEYYAERKGNPNPKVCFHFYKLIRATDALSTLRSSAHQFGNVELVRHKKEIGTNPNPIKKDDLSDDDDDYGMIKSRS